MAWRPLCTLERAAPRTEIRCTPSEHNTTARPPQYIGTAHAAKARRRRRRRRSRCGRCTSVRPAGSRKSEISPPSACAGREHSGRASSSETTCRSSLLLRVSTGTRLLKTSIVCSSAPRLHLAVGIAFPERQSPGALCCPGGRAARVPTLVEKLPLVKAWVQQLHARPPQALLTPRPAAGAAHGVDDARASDLP